VQVDRLGQRQEADGIEAGDETAACMFEVVLDREVKAAFAQLRAGGEAAGDLPAA
jgi:hypothetical protein